MDPGELLQAIIDSPTQHGIVVTDTRGRVCLWNTGAARIFQYRADEIIGRSAEMLFAADDVARGVPGNEMMMALRNGCSGDFRWHVRKDASMFWADGMTYPVRQPSGGHFGFVKILRDATEEKRSGDLNSRLALEDSLTGLPNRAEFRNRFVDMAASALRHGHPLILLLVDLDRFKEVNDTLGHAIGDAVLQQAAHRMRATVRETDAIARLGGDEFAILQPDAESGEVGGAVAEKLVQALSRPFQIGEREIRIGASVGLSVYPQDAVDFDALFGKADRALYRAKADGRSSYHFYTAQMDAVAHRRSIEHQQLRRAVKDRAFSLAYQPQVDAGGNVLAVEALLRCSNPFFAHYPIEKIVELAAETGRLRRLGLWAFAEASRQTRKWQLEGRPGLRLSMNFCRVELAEVRFAQRVLELLHRAGLSPADLEIDIPEPDLIDGFDPTPIIELHDRGVSIAIDNLGTGGLSLKHLFTLPIDSVKLDLEVLPGLPDDRRSRDIASAIAQLAHALDMRVVAERVESPAAADFLRPLCDGMQGNLFVEPLGAEQMTEWLVEHGVVATHSRDPRGASLR